VPAGGVAAGVAGVMVNVMSLTVPL
jgi:hypothetical protein